MAKALFLGLPLHGHITPSLALVRELVARGDEVMYYASDLFAATIEKSGARYRPYRSTFVADLTRLSERLEQLPWLLMRTTADILDVDLPAFRRDGPDYLITDSVAPWGQWAAQVLGVPVVTSVSTFAFNRNVLAFAAVHGVRPRSARILLSKLRHMVKAHRLARRVGRQHAVKGTGVVGLVAGRSDLNIVYTSRHFQPCAETFDDHFLFVGPSMASTTETTPIAWDAALHLPVVYVSLGTIFNTDVVFYRHCFEAFRHEHVHVIMSIGTNVDKASLGPSPANVTVRASVPQLEVLGRASAFVTHGGMNSVSESLYHGVPVLVVPQMGEQAIVGRRVEQLGAGLYLAKEEADPQRLRESVRRLLVETRFRDQAGVIGESFKAAGGAARAADAIQAFTRARDGSGASSMDRR